MFRMFGEMKDGMHERHVIHWKSPTQSELVTKPAAK